MENQVSRSAELIDKIANGYREAQILLTANRLGVFHLLADQRLSLDQMAEALQVSRRGLRILCDALVALTLLSKDGEAYFNSEAAKHCLLLSSPAPKREILLHGARLYQRWGALYQAVREGGSVSDQMIDSALQHDERDFARAMADSGRAMASQTADALDLSGVRRLLDLGGGPGIYAIEFVRRNAELQVTLFDSPATLDVARERIAEAGLDGRIELRTGDAFADPLGGPYDVIFMSNVIHAYSAAENVSLVKRCADALTEKGRLCIKDFFLEEGRTSPAGAAIFAVNMLVNTENGDCYTFEETCSWLSDADLLCLDKRFLTAQSGIVIGQKR
jgi:ubiquinone/menaquinone biosynthesis C-methylase UbiE